MQLCIRHPCNNSIFTAKRFKANHKMDFVSSQMDFLSDMSGSQLPEPAQIHWETVLRGIYQNAFQPLKRY
jgi:hypothetical protein